MGMEEISRSRISRPGAEIDERVRDFLTGPIEGDSPYLRPDATLVKVREAGRIVPVGVSIAVGVSAGGRREVLGPAMGSPEAEPLWLAILRMLQRHGQARREGGLPFSQISRSNRSHCIAWQCGHGTKNRR